LDVDIEGKKLWLPDLHIWEARQFSKIKGLSRKREHVMVSQDSEKHPTVSYNFNFNSVLACHFNTSHFPLASNRCLVRFGSYTQDRTKVVFEQNSSFVSNSVQQSKFSFKVSPLHEMAKEVSRAQPRNKEHGKDKIVMAYDGFQVIVSENITSRELQYFITMWVLVSMAMLGIFFLSGHPDPIDRAGHFSMALLGSVLLFVQITTNTPHGYEHQANPVMGFLKFSIGVIVACFSCYCILVRLTSDRVIMGHMQDRMELVVFMIFLLSYVAWCSIYFSTSYSSATGETCHNLIH